MLEVRNLGVRYGRHQALEGVSARVEKGEICVILGANGAGKSSLLKAIAGVVKAEPGSQVVMNGQPIAGSDRQMRSCARVPETVEPGCIARSGPAHPRLEDATDGVSIEEQRQASHVDVEDGEAEEAEDDEDAADDGACADAGVGELVDDGQRADREEQERQVGIGEALLHRRAVTILETAIGPELVHTLRVRSAR